MSSRTRSAVHLIWCVAVLAAVLPACEKGDGAPRRLSPTCDIGARAMCSDALIGVVRADDPMSQLCFALRPNGYFPTGSWFMVSHPPWQNGTTRFVPRYDEGRMTGFVMECSTRADEPPTVASVEWDEAGRPVRVVDTQQGKTPLDTRLDYAEDGQTMTFETITTTSTGDVLRTGMVEFDSEGRASAFQQAINDVRYQADYVYDADRLIRQMIIDSNPPYYTDAMYALDLIYDSMGRLAEIRGETTQTIQWNSDTELLVAHDSSLGFFRHEITLDDAGRMIEVRMLPGRDPTDNEPFGVFRWERDASGRVVEALYDVWDGVEWEPE